MFGPTSDTDTATEQIVKCNRCYKILHINTRQVFYGFGAPEQEHTTHNYLKKIRVQHETGVESHRTSSRRSRQRRPLGA